MAHLRGAIIYEALKNGIKVIEPTPTQIKEFITGYGRATKRQVMSSLKFFINNFEAITKGKPLDVYDAIAVAISGYFLEKL